MRVLVSSSMTHLEDQCWQKNKRNSHRKNQQQKSWLRNLTKFNFSELWESFVWWFISNVFSYFQIPVTTTRILLNHFRWDKEKLMERYYDGDQEALFKAAHVINPYVKPKRESKVMTDVHRDANDLRTSGPSSREWKVFPSRSMIFRKNFSLSCG